MKKLRLIVHSFIGHILCKMCLVYWNVRDTVIPPTEKTVLFVTHPDDDTLFFHSFIKKYKPYVVVMTAGHSVNRLKCFSKNMKRYGVKFRAYDQGTDDTRETIVRKRVRHVMGLGNFELCATHNAKGEYGHPMHICVHNAVTTEVSCPILVPDWQENILQHPLPESEVEEKKQIFYDIYSSELFVLDVWPHWVNNEHLVPNE